MKVYFADTFFFVALMNHRDQHHEKASAFYRQFEGRLLTTEWVLIEVADGLAKGSGRRQVSALIRDLRESADCEVISLTNSFFDQALHLYDLHRDKQWTLTDCASFVIMRERGLSEALTGDHHFEQAGFVALLK